MDDESGEWIAAGNKCRVHEEASKTNYSGGGWYKNACRKFASCEGESD